MVKINKIYTRTGDDGTTGLCDGSRVSKDSLRVCAYGDIDELNAVLGIVAVMAHETQIGAIYQKVSIVQNELFDIGAELATPAQTQRLGAIRVTTSEVTRLETWIDELSKDLPELSSFVLPGGTQLNAFLHLARTVARRAERTVMELSRSETVATPLYIYLNRLSDLLFAMARYASFSASTPEVLWEPGKRLPSVK